MPNRIIWSFHVKEYLRQHAQFKTDTQLAEEISRIVGRPMTRAAIRNERYRLGLIKEGGRGKTNLRD